MAAALTLAAIRIHDAQQGPPLERWHTFVPDELRADDLDEADWSQYLEAEAAVFTAVDDEVTAQLDPADRVAVNRYFADSPVHPGHFAQDWNRSFTLEPTSAPLGAVVLLHGLTDAPYSQRHVARLYREHGFVAIAIRLPGHGTVPAALTDVDWEDWLAATRLAMREARRRVGPALPLHLVGFSNGGALAVKYALDVLEDERLPRADRVVLISPMIGITRFARFAGLTALPALFPAFAKTAWLSVMPEFNPFKYNSFPVNGATQSHRLTVALQEQIAAGARDGALTGLPPILTFQSVIDFTVSTSAIVSAFYDHLPANGSELVLFDVNRNFKFGPLLSSVPATTIARLLPAPPRRFRTTVITNGDATTAGMVERVTDARSVTEESRPLDLSFPADVYSLSHVALPFPLSDGLYGLKPDPKDDFGINLGTIAARGEVGALVVNMSGLLRMTSNPFFPYMLDRIAEDIPSQEEQT